MLTDRNFNTSFFETALRHSSIVCMTGSAIFTLYLSISADPNLSTDKKAEELLGGISSNETVFLGPMNSEMIECNPIGSRFHSLAVNMSRTKVKNHFKTGSAKSLSPQEKGLHPALWSRISYYVWGKLPNSGNLLKLKVPSYNREVIRGWSNFSSRGSLAPFFFLFFLTSLKKRGAKYPLVTSLEILEREMEYRGSKFTATGHGGYNQAGLGVINEQRVNGNCHSIRLRGLRCTLMGFEKNSQYQILSNQINQIRLYSSVKSNL